MKQSIVEAYRTLGLENDASLDLIKSTYKQVALRTHPDKNPDDPDATEQFQRVSESYNVLLKHLDTIRRPTHGFQDYDSESDEDYLDEYDDYDSDLDLGDLDFYMFLYEEMLRGRSSKFAEMRYQHRYAFHHSSEEYQSRSRRSREEQVEAEGRRKKEAVLRKAQAEVDRENERIQATKRKQNKSKVKRSQAEAKRNKAEATAQRARQQAQERRSAIFEAARSGDMEKVKIGIWEQGVDATGGEFQGGCQPHPERQPGDPLETLSHIVARKSDRELVEWLDRHGADPEERDSQGMAAFHVALQSGHKNIVDYFFETYDRKDDDSNAIYHMADPESLLSLAVTTGEPELVWMILERDLASQEHINSSWLWITSAQGRSAVKITCNDDEKFEDVMKLLMRFGGFTPPTSPRSDDDTMDDRAHSIPSTAQGQARGEARGSGRGRDRGPGKI